MAERERPEKREEQRKPDVSKPTTSPDRAAGYEYAEALSDLMSEPRASAPERRSKAGPRRSGPSKGFIVTLLLLAFGGVAGWSLYTYLAPVEPAPPQSQQRAGRIMLFHAVKAIEEHRQARGSLPSHLSLLQIPKGNYEYVRADTGYTIYLTLPDVVVSYRSGDDFERLLAQAGVR